MPWDASLSLGHRMAELRSVAADLRAGRATRRSDSDPRLGRLRIAIGRALLGAAATLLADGQLNGAVAR